MATKTEVQLVVSAKDQASATLKKVGISLQGLMQAGKVVGAGLAVAGTAVAAFGVKSIKAFAESEKEMARFNATLATMGKKGEEARGGLLKAADAAVQLGFDDEDAANSLAKLFQRTGDVNEAMQLNAVAMDIARGKGIELADANRIVNLALSGNTKELKLLGIEVDDNATGLENLRAVQEKYAGQAQSFAGTTAGKLEILSKSWGNVQESLGKALVDGLKVNEWLDKLAKYVSSESFQNGISKLGSAISATVKAAASAVKTLQGVLESVFYVMFRSIDIAKEKWGSFKSTVSSSVSSVKSSWDSLKSTLSKPIEGIVNIVEKIKSKSKSKDKKALGGPVSAGTPYLVGEQRPEVFVPSQSGNIRQLGDVSGGKIEVIFNNPVVRSDYDLQEIIRAVKDSIARSQNMERYGIRTV